MDTIDIFLMNWKEKAFRFYFDLYKEYYKRSQEISEMNKENPYRHTEEQRIESKKLLKWKYSLPSVAQDIIGWREEGAKERLNKILDKEVERKKKNLINRIEKKAGKIVDTSYLSIGGDGEINGYIIGTKANVEIETISAGGYNIQCYHYRVLVKEIK